jgi:inhibitor of KinA
MSDTIRIFPLGDSALTVEFGNVISPDLNAKAIALANVLLENSFPGFIEAVPAYASTTIFYDLVRVRKEFPNFQTAFEAVKYLASSLMDKVGEGTTAAFRTIELPVRFDPDSAPDLDLVAEKSGMAADEVIKIFTSKTYRVYMLGFLPGFTYMGEVDERIAVPRKETPRTLVEKGSVGIAGKQTGVYSLASPGGWQIIGRTDVEMFTPRGDEPTYFKPGDEVRFVPV